MDITLLDLLLALLENTCVIAVFAYLLVHSRYFLDFVAGRKIARNAVVLILAFGLISVLGTMLGITVSAGAIANVRDVGPDDRRARRRPGRRPGRGADRWATPVLDGRHHGLHERHRHDHFRHPRRASCST